MEAENLSQQTCVNCGHLFSGRYCNQCGEKVLDENDRKISHFFEEFVHMLTHADHKFFKTLRYLFSRPGFLTQEYLRGCRKRYTLPLSLFFIGNLIYLLAPSVDALNSRYVSQMTGQPYSHTIQKAGKEKMKERQWNTEQMNEHYDHASSKVSKIMLVLIVFMFSVPITVLFYDQKRYYFNHLVFATEFINFVIYGILLVLPWIFFLILAAMYYGLHIKWQPNINADGSIFSTLALLWIFLAVASKRVYNQSWPVTLTKSAILTVSMIVIIIAYRFVLFQVTMAFL